MVKQIDRYIQSNSQNLTQSVNDNNFQMLDCGNISSSLSNESPKNKFKILNTMSQFLNSNDRDFSTPLILALTNQKNSLVQLIMSNKKACLTQLSLKYGTALHVALNNQDFRTAFKIMKQICVDNEMNKQKEFNKLDQEENTALHYIMRYFNEDVDLASKLAFFLLQNGADITIKNKNGYTCL